MTKRNNPSSKNNGLSFASMKLNPDEYEGLWSFQVLTPAQKKGSVFRQNLAILISTTKRKEAKKPEIIAI